MRFVLLALSRPITVVIALIAVALASMLAFQRMRVDIFPQVGDPVIYVWQPYGGMDPQQMEGYLTYYYEYHFLYITGMDHVESRSIRGQALLKLVFHQGTDMAAAMGETMGYVRRYANGKAGSNCENERDSRRKSARVTRYSDPASVRNDGLSP